MKMIKLLLTENVDNLGIVGDVVAVRPGYARNFLLPHGIGTKPTESNVKRLAARRTQVELELKENRAKLEALLEKLKGLELTMQRSANEQGVLFGGVSQHDISQAVRAEGLDIDDRAVRIGQQIKRLDSYAIPIVLAADLKTEIKLWVVSDKPTEKLEAEPKPTGPAAPAEREGGQGDKPGETRPERKGRKPREQDQGEKAPKAGEDKSAEKADAGEPKKKARKEKAE